MIQQDRNRDGNWDGKERARENSNLRCPSAPIPAQEKDQLIYNTRVVLEYVNRRVSSGLREEVLSL